MNGASDATYREAVETLLGGGMDASAAEALEARIRDASAAGWEDYATLKALGSDLEAIGAALASQAARVDFVEDVQLCVDLEAVGDSSAAVLSEVDLTEEVALRAGLVSLGERFAAAVPPVDLVDAVAQAVAAEKSKANVVTLRARERGQSNRRYERRNVVVWLGFAAAACVLLAVTLGALRVWFGPEYGQGTFRTARDMRHMRPVGPLTPDSGGDAGDGTIARVVPEPVSASATTLEPAAEPQPEKPEANPYDAITMENILLARANAINGGDGDRAFLAGLASLSPEEVRRLLEKANLSREAILGAALFLPPEEAVNLLLAKLSQSPNDPYLRYALAKNLGEMEGGAEEARRQLAEWRRTDPNNAMPYMMEAELALREKDIDAALLAFEQAAGYDQAYGYAAETANNRVEALVAAGYGGEEARLLAAATAGSQEYLHIRELTKDLLEQGRYYESIGDYATAESIYGAVRQFGQDVWLGATYINEELAGLETQHDALGSLQGLYEVLGDPQTADALMQSFTLLAQAFEDLRTYIESYNSVFASGDMNWINVITNLVLQQGDRALPGLPAQE